MKNVLLTNENIIKSTTNIFESINGNYLLPSIKIAQDIDLEEIIGTELLRKLQSDVYNNKFEDKYKTLLDDYVVPFLNYSTIVRLIPTVAFKISNAGVTRTDDEKMTNLSATEIDKVEAEYRHIADVYKNKLQRYLIANYNEYPELTMNNTIDKIKQNLYSSASCGVSLGGVRGRYIKG